MMQWYEREGCKSVLHDSSTVDCSQAGQDTSRTDLMLHEASALPVLDFAMDYPSDNDLQPPQWPSFGCDDDMGVKQELFDQLAMDTDSASMFAAEPILPCPSFIDLTCSEQPTARTSVSRAPSLQHQASYTAPPFSFVSQSVGARLAPYPAQRPFAQNMSVKVEEELSQPLWVTNATAQSSISSTASMPSSGYSYREKAMHRRSTSLASSFSSVDPKGEPDWSCSHLSRPIVYSVHSVYNGSPSFSPPRAPNSPDALAYRFLMSQANAINGNPMTSQKDRERARTEWVQEWLRTSYKRAPNSTVPRQALYASYVESCKTYNMKPQNSASFGKSVRTAFKGIKTRRLGRRGDSRYHYVSIAAAIAVEAERLNRYGDSTGVLHQVIDDDESGSRHIDDYDDGDELSDDESYQDGYSSSLQRDPSSGSVNAETSHPSFGRHSTSTSFDSIASSILSRPPLTHLAGFPEPGPLAISNDAINHFWTSFVNYLEGLITSVEQFNAGRFELSMRAFWPDVAVLKDVLQSAPVSVLIMQALAVTYNEIVRTLMDNVLDSQLGRPMSSMRKLAYTLEKIAVVSLQDFDAVFSEPKVELAARTGHLLVRLCDIQQLTTTLLPILSSRDRIEEMLHAWNKIDIDLLISQAALVCNCQQSHLEEFLSEFCSILGTARSCPGGDPLGILRAIADQIQTIASMVKTEGKVLSRGFLIRLSFVTSQIMRDLTLRSDSAFGLFQLLKTWIDDWCGLIVLRHIAICSTVEPAFGSTPQGSSQPKCAPLQIHPPQQEAWYSASEAGGPSALTPRPDRPLSKEN